MKLTNEIRKHPLSKKGQKTLRDTTPGFFAIIGKRRRTFYFQCETTRLGKRTVIKKAIGPVEDWDVQDARIEALKQIKAIKDGAATKRQVTLGAAWDSYRMRLERRIANGQQSDRTLEAYTDKMDRMLKDWIDVPLRDLSDDPMMIAARHRAITDDHGPIMANMAMKVLRCIYRHARDVGLERGLPAELPTSAVEMNPEDRRETALAQKDMAAWYKQLRALPSVVRQEHHLFTLFSGARTGSLRQARWADVEGRFLRIPNPKGGPKRAYNIPLSQAMLDCLERAKAAGQMERPYHAAEYIFPGEHGPLSHSKEPRTHKRGVHPLSHWGGCLRQTHKSVSVIVEVDELLSRLLLGHALSGTSEGYISKNPLAAPLLAAQEKISTYIVEGLMM